MAPKMSTFLSLAPKSMLPDKENFAGVKDIDMEELAWINTVGSNVFTSAIMRGMQEGSESGKEM